VDAAKSSESRCSRGGGAARRSARDPRSTSYPGKHIEKGRRAGAALPGPVDGGGSRAWRDTIAIPARTQGSATRCTTRCAIPGLGDRRGRDAVGPLHRRPLPTPDKAHRPDRRGPPRGLRIEIDSVAGGDRRRVNRPAVMQLGDRASGSLEGIRRFASPWPAREAKSSASFAETQRASAPRDGRPEVGAGEVFDRRHSPTVKKRLDEAAGARAEARRGATTTDPPSAARPSCATGDPRARARASTRRKSQGAGRAPFRDVRFLQGERWTGRGRGRGGCQVDRHPGLSKLMEGRGWRSSSTWRNRPPRPRGRPGRGKSRPVCSNCGCGGSSAPAYRTPNRPDRQLSLSSAHPASGRPSWAPCARPSFMFDSEQGDDPHRHVGVTWRRHSVVPARRRAARLRGRLRGGRASLTEGLVAGRPVPRSVAARRRSREAPSTDVFQRPAPGDGTDGRLTDRPGPPPSTSRTTVLIMDFQRSRAAIEGVEATFKPEVSSTGSTRFVQFPPAQLAREIGQIRRPPGGREGWPARCGVREQRCVEDRADY